MADFHPQPDEFTPDEVKNEPILRYFHYSHLPKALQARSQPFCALARGLFDGVPKSDERTAAFRKLVEAKDCAVRAALPPL